MELLNTENNIQQIFDNAESIEDVLLDCLMNIEQSIEVQRTSLWMLKEDDTVINCLSMLDKDVGLLIELAALTEKEYPCYFEALKSGKIIVANDAQKDPSTCEFTDNYLIPYKITSMLDVPIFKFEKLVGIICCEHIGPIREWTTSEQEVVLGYTKEISQLLERL